MYDLPKFNDEQFKKNASKALKGTALIIVIFIAIGFVIGNIFWNSVKDYADYFFQQFQYEVAQPVVVEQKPVKYVSDIPYEQAIIAAVKKTSPSVVSIVISKNLPVYEEQLVNPFGDIPSFESPFNFQIPQYVQKGTKLQEVGAGSGFIVSEDGLVLTNKHVVSDAAAEYTVILNDHAKYKAKVLALDPVQDIAILKIVTDGLVDSSGQVKKFPTSVLGDSNGIEIGQGAIAIGNALGQFSNSVSVGIVSGLGRTVSASDQGGSFSETLENIIQTDAAINSGNSGGPLINLKGEVIGVNTAMAQGAQSIGFAIPINIAKRDINQVIKSNKIMYPFLGVRYVLVDEEVQKKYNLSVDYGAIILQGEKGEAAIVKDSSAEKAGLKAKDVILEFNGEKISKDNPMTKIIQNYNPEDKINLKILRDGKEIMVDVILGQRS